MHGQKAVVILGAGASYCYEDASGPIPTQEHMLKKLFFGADTSSGKGFPSFASTYGLMHSFELGEYLRDRYEIPEYEKDKNQKMDFWVTLQEKGYNLESLFGELEAELSDSRANLIQDFEAIVRCAVATPPGERSRDDVCRYHRSLVEQLEPGDCIVNFNWDSLAADALLYDSLFWFPATGFGLPYVASISNYMRKNYPVRSHIELLHVHGAVVLFERIDELSKPNVAPFMYLGPKTLNEMGSMKALMDDRGGGGLEESESRMLDWGCRYIQGTWYRPIFSPPSRHKSDYSSKYSTIVRKAIYEHLNHTDSIYVAGYSAPDADLAHLKRLFPAELIDPDVFVCVINPQNSDPDFQNRMSQVFPSVEKIDFSNHDFAKWAE